MVGISEFHPETSDRPVPLLRTQIDGDHCGAFFRSLVEVTELRGRLPAGFRIGYSGDWCAAPAFLAGADAWHSVVAGLLPEPALKLTRAAMAGDATEVERLQSCFAPMWSLFEQKGSLRAIYGIAELLGIEIGSAPLPVRGYTGADQLSDLSPALQQMMSA